MAGLGQKPDNNAFMVEGYGRSLHGLEDGEADTMQPRTQSELFSHTGLRTPLSREVCHPESCIIGALFLLSLSYHLPLLSTCLSPLASCR